MTLEPWSRGKRLLWDATIRDPFAASYQAISRTPGAVASKAETEKRQKYSCLESEFWIVPAALKSTGVCGEAALALVKEIGRRITYRSGERRARSFIVQRISLEIQRGNARMVGADRSLQSRVEATEL